RRNAHVGAPSLARRALAGRDPRSRPHLRGRRRQVHRAVHRTHRRPATNRANRPQQSGVEVVMRVVIEKKTDQLNYEDFLGGVTRTVTIAGVKKGTKEQQYDIEIEGDQRVWRPAVTVLKLLVEAWGDDATVWVGRRATLYGDPEVKFGREKVGGIRVSHLSHI